MQGPTHGGHFAQHANYMLQPYCFSVRPSVTLAACSTLPLYSKQIPVKIISEVGYYYITSHYNF